MASNYTRPEMETVINWNLGDKDEVFISTSQPAVMRAMARVSVKPYTESKSNSQYKVSGKRYRLTVSGGKFRISDKKNKKPMTPAQKKNLQALAKRIKLRKKD